MSLEVYGFRVVGTSPLLMHSPQAMRPAGAPTGTTVKTVPTPEEEAEAGAYRDEGGGLYLPSSAFRASLLAGAKGRRIGKDAATTAVMGSVFAVEPRVELVHPETGERLTDYRVHVARVVVQRSAVMRARPEISEWAGIVRFELDLELGMQPFFVEELLNIAGRRAGVGDWRPEKRGSHGRYKATLLDRPDAPVEDGRRSSEDAARKSGTVADKVDAAVDGAGG